MYWKVQKLGPEQLLKSYGIHILLAVSVIVNGVLWLSLPKTNKMSGETKQNIDVFVRQVTTHLLDSSYITCQQNVLELRKELSPQVLNMLVQSKILPGNDSELMGLVKDMTERKQICSVRIDSLKTGDPTAAGLIPVQVQGVCAIHSATDTGERGFVFQYLIGQHVDTKAFLIAECRDLTPQAAPAAEETQ